MAGSNGSQAAAVNDALTAEPPRPPWSDVDPWAIIGQLQGQLAAKDTEMAAMRVYIAQLHQGLQAAAGGGVTVPPEEGA